MNRIKELREYKNLSQIEVANAINTSQRNISRWENEENEITCSFIIKLADYFDVSIDYLLGRENDYGVIENKSGLNDSENLLLSLFRSLDKDDKNKVIGYIQALKY